MSTQPTIRCRYCGGQHHSVPEVRACWDRKNDSSAERRKATAEQRADDRRMAAREVDRSGLRYESAEVQSKRAIEEVRRRLASDGHRVDAWGGSDTVRTAFNEMVDELVGSDRFDDTEELSSEGVDHLVDGRHWYASWTIDDERIRTPEQSAFSLSEGEEAPPASPWEIDWQPTYLADNEPDSSLHATGTWNRAWWRHIDAMAGKEHTDYTRPSVPGPSDSSAKPERVKRHNLFGTRYALQVWDLVADENAWYERRGGRR